MGTHFKVIRIIFALGALCGGIASWFDIYAGFYGSLVSNLYMGAIALSIYEYEQVLVRYLNWDLSTT
jgi:hypothetical protein